MGDDATLLNPGARSVRFVWAAVGAALVVGTCTLFGLLQWCGDGVETCESAGLAAELATRALVWSAAGGLMAGTILAVSPWSRRPRTRIFTGSVVALGTMLLTGLYLLG